MTFDKQLAIECAKFCQASYATCTVADAKTDTQVLVDGTMGRVRIAFRGTYNTEGWLRDLDIRKVGYGGMRLHAGFFGDVQSVFTELESYIPQITTPVIITGHSKGAAEAVLFAYMLKEAGCNVVAVYTFGEPRGGDLAWRAKYDALLGLITWRVTHAADIVPWIPTINYWHITQHAWLPATGGVVFNPSIVRQLATNHGELLGKYAARQIRKAGHPEDRLPSLAPLHLDHAISAYITALEAL